MSDARLIALSATLAIAGCGAPRPAADVSAETARARFDAGLQRVRAEMAPGVIGPRGRIESAYLAETMENGTPRQSTCATLRFDGGEGTFRMIADAVIDGQRRPSLINGPSPDGDHLWQRLCGTPVRTGDGEIGYRAPVAAIP